MKRTIVAPVLAVFAAASLLTACSGTVEDPEGNVAEAVTEKVAEGVTGTDLDVDIEDGDVDLGLEDADIDLGIDGEASIPEEWPGDVPIPDATPVFSTFANNAVAVSFKATSADGAADYRAKLESSGFEVMTELGDLGVVLQNDSYGVTISKAIQDGADFNVAVLPR